MLIDTHLNIFEKCIAVKNSNGSDTEEEESMITGSFELVLRTRKNIIHERTNNGSMRKEGSKRNCEGVNLCDTKRTNKQSNKIQALNTHSIINLQLPAINVLLKL